MVDLAKTTDARNEYLGGEIIDYNEEGASNVDVTLIMPLGCNVCSRFPSLVMSTLLHDIDMHTANNHRGQSSSA
jgi:hypothetical protein